MFQVPREPKRLLLGAGALVLVSLFGWGSFASLAVTSSQRIASLSAERDSAVAERQRLVEKAGQLADLEAKATLARAEYGRAVQALTDVKARMAAAQHELAGVTRRAETLSDRVNQTGSIRQPEPPKRPAR